MATIQEASKSTPASDPYTRGCPSRDVLDQIGSKRPVLVTGELGRHGARRFTQLRQQLGGISEKMLTQTLRTLKRDELILRTVYPEVILTPCHGPTRTACGGPTLVGVRGRMTA